MIGFIIYHNGVAIAAILVIAPAFGIVECVHLSSTAKMQLYTEVEGNNNIANDRGGKDRLASLIIGLMSP